MNDSSAGDVVWQPFVDALCSAAWTWDAHLGRISGSDGHPVPISSEQAQNVLLALTSLARRMAAATASIVGAIADAELDPASEEEALSEQVESLGRMALFAEAMHHAAETAQAVVTREQKNA
ncbi:hypothetical protein V1227_13555 [Lentzea sp. DG1S-22]|uniref:hypothetical protein n=1 Tax=Lentzea sp. DG1S-22 TaxID=3108822 RepID=UPI002E795075|nr:hypothetical protein [Lentzea sp. DG1S-22]WVH83728.1 hypothetical protein V1227_13555 [Lentzea sp. DG1S-22]